MAYFNQNDYDYARKSADFAQNLNAMQSPLSGLFGAGNNIYNQQNSRAGADLANNSFMRIHRSWIINLIDINEVNKNRILMNDGMYVPIGDMYREGFLNYVDSKFLDK